MNLDISTGIEMEILKTLSAFLTQWITDYKVRLDKIIE